LKKQDWIWIAKYDSPLISGLHQGSGTYGSREPDVSDLVETVTFDTETETWLKFRDETETSSKIPRPSIET